MTHQPFNDAHALSGAYAVDALDDLERARFEEHLRDCAECRDEVESLREAASALAVDAETAPPPALRDAVLAAIETVRPLPPLQDSDTASPAPTPATAPAPTPLDARRRSRLPFLLAAAAVAILAIVGITQWQPWTDDSKPELTAAERVLADLDAKRTRLDLEDAKVTLVVSRAEGRAVLLAEDLDPAPEGRDYQVWLQDPEGALAPAGLLPDDEEATVLLDGDPTKATWVGITIEPDGGSQQPTTKPIAFAAIKRT